MAVPTEARSFLTQLFEQAVAAAQPARLVPRHLPDVPPGRTIVLGAGKASAQMAAAFEKAWPEPVSGLIVTQYGAGLGCAQIEVVEAAHPVPDEAGLHAAQRLLAMARDAGQDDLVVALISGGGSSLLPAPAEGLSLADEQAINRELLQSGAPISAMNCVRKMFSTIKGGRLAVAAHPARVVSLVMSDVPGDDAAMVASGPTVADENGLSEARTIVAQYDIALPAAARALLDEGGNVPPGPDDPRLARAQHYIIASAAMSLDSAAQAAREAGYDVRVLSDAIEGEARDVGAWQAQLIQDLVAKRPLPRPQLLLSGGETTVTIGRGETGGKGGRNTEYLLALAVGIAGLDNVLALAADTDGRDGSENNAGAFADGTSIARMHKAGVDAEKCLANHDAWSAFNATQDLLVTGPTGTNVNDFRALLVW